MAVTSLSSAQCMQLVAIVEVTSIKGPIVLFQVMSNAYMQLFAIVEVTSNKGHIVLFQT